MSSGTVTKIPVTKLIVQALEPEVSTDPNSDIFLPVTYRIEGETQFSRIVIPRESGMAKHPAFAAAMDIAQGRKPERTLYEVNGVITIKMYKRKEDGSSALSSRLKLSAPMVECEKEEELPDLSFLKVRTYEKESKKRGAKEVSCENCLSSVKWWEHIVLMHLYVSLL